MHDFLVDLLICPACHAELDWSIKRRSLNHVEDGEARCRSCQAIYPVRNSIGYFLSPDSDRKDLWQEVDSQLIQYLNQHPEIEEELMDVPLDSLSPADQFFRAMVLEERGEYKLAEECEAVAQKGIYTTDYLDCWQSLTDQVVKRLENCDGPIIDLASGRDYLVEVLAQQLGVPVVATDFSPRVLQRNRHKLDYLGIYERVSLLAFDARRMPFRDDALMLVTSNQGLPNIQEPLDFLREIRRVLSGHFLSITHFYPLDDQENREALRQAELETMLVKDLALAAMDHLGLTVELSKECFGTAKPTPVGRVLNGAGIDVFPVSQTTLEWCLLQIQ